MSEPALQRHARGLTASEIAALIGIAPPQAVPQRTITGIAALDRAGPADLSFFDQPRLAAAAAKTHAGICLTTEAMAGDLPAGVVALAVIDPYCAFVAVARELFPGSLRPSSLYPANETAGANVHPTAWLESGVTLEPGAVIGPGAEIGAGTVIGANAVVGARVRIGRDCSIGAGSSISDALIGDRIIIHAGCRIGQDGFGFTMDRTHHRKIPQLGRVIIQDDVEIGAGTAVDRGFIRDTVIGAGTKIDNLVQVGHNVSIGRNCIIVAQTGISGSATLEDFVVLGARVGLHNNVTIGEGAQIAAVSGVHGDVPPGARWGGTPAKPVRQWFNEIRALAHLARRRGGPAKNDE